jgi:hypothetical protein
LPLNSTESPTHETNTTRLAKIAGLHTIEAGKPQVAFGNTFCDLCFCLSCGVVTNRSKEAIAGFDVTVARKNGHFKFVPFFFREFDLCLQGLFKQVIDDWNPRSWFAAGLFPLYKLKTFCTSGCTSRRIFAKIAQRARRRCVVPRKGTGSAYAAE